MSMPMPLHVVVVGEKSETAGVVAAILRANRTGSVNPEILAASASLPSEKPMFFLESKKHKFSLNVAPSCFFFNPKRINLWIALDETSEKDARRNIKPSV
jgi:hypothetical protein